MNEVAIYDRKKYHFAVYESPTKYRTFTVIGELQKKMVYATLRNNNIWFVISELSDE